jgi:hypothetical protein
VTQVAFECNPISQSQLSGVLLKENSASDAAAFMDFGVEFPQHMA